MEAKVISAFPACGKSYFYENFQNCFNGILDSDSSEFSWIKDENGNNTDVRNPDFPNNYIQHIKDNLDKVDIIFVSSHEVVRHALWDNGIDYLLVYPNKDLKNQWIERFKKRGNNDKFINFISNNWDKFINDMDEETFPYKFRINKEIMFMDDVIHYLRMYKILNK